MSAEREAVDLAAVLKLRAEDVDGLEAIHDALVAVRDARDAEWRAAYHAEGEVRANVFRMTEAECQQKLAPIRKLERPMTHSARVRCPICGRRKGIRGPVECEGVKVESTCLRLGYEREKIRAEKALAAVNASDKPTAGPLAVPALPSGARQQEGPGAKLVREARELREKYEPLTEGAASAASPDVSAEDATVRALRPLRLAEVRLPRYDAAYQSTLAEIRAAYARGLAERDARWREALGRMGLLNVAGHLVCEDCGLTGCDACSHLRTLLGSGATAPTAPPSPSGALAGAEEMTPKEKK